MNFKLSGVERQVLREKFKKEGLGNEQVKERINSIDYQLDALISDLRKKRRSEKFIQTKFMEEFEKLCSGR